MDTESKILYICTGHQDQDYKVDYLLEILKKVKSEGGDICYGTHCDYRLDDIYEYCDYVIYDKNNEYLNEEYFLENCQEINDDSFSGFFNYTYSPNNDIELIKLFNTSHTKPCIINIKNSISVAKSNNYDWVVYFEYDSLLPDGNLHDKIKKRVRVLENMNKNGYAYIAEDMRKGLLFPHLFISKTDVFYNDEKFKKTCNTNLEFLKVYGNIVSEEILFDIFNNDNFILTSSFNLESDYEYNADLKGSLSGNDRFSLFDASESKHHKTDVDIFMSSCKLEIYPLKISDGLYNIDFWLIQRNDVSYIFDYIKVKIDGVNVIYLENFVRDYQGWYTANIINGYNVDYNSDTLVEIDYQVNLPNSEKLSDTFKINLKYIDKYHLYKMTSPI